ncbi:MAG TPA: hypothetical protein GX516_05250 [Thermoanaerobacter sp.]|nr:hypothetical protein [Thermoanaerobacter sp.]
MKEPKTMKELHKIRTESYKYRKNMTSEQFIADIEKNAEKAKKYMAKLKTTIVKS